MPDKGNFIAVLVGGALALAGVIVSQISGLWSGWIDRRYQRDVRRRERLENMADAISGTISWSQNLAKCRTMDEIRSHQAPPEAQRIVTLALLYLPRLREPAEGYLNSLVGLYEFAVECYRRDEPGTIGEVMGMVVERQPELEKVLRQPMVFRQQLDDAIAAEAEKYAHA